VRSTTVSGGAAAAIHLALTDLRKTPEFATAFAHIRRSKNLSDDFGVNGHGNGNGNGNGAENYSAAPPKALKE
jgi:hypothetical protein